MLSYRKSRAIPGTMARRLRTTYNEALCIKQLQLRTDIIGIESGNLSIPQLTKQMCHQSVSAIASTKGQILQIVDSLNNVGFSKEDISVLLQDEESVQQFARVEITSVLSGASTGALIAMGIPELEAKRYGRRIAEGNLLISVHATTLDDMDRAKDILDRAGTQDISTVPQVEDRRSQT